MTVEAHPTDPIRAELFYGAVYGLGLSSIIWATVLFPPPLVVETAGLFALALGLGLLRPRLPWIGPISLVLPVALGATCSAGISAGVIAAALTGLTGTLREAGSSDAPRPRQAGLQTIAAAMSAFIAGLAYISVGGPVEAGALSQSHVAAVLLHGVAFQAVHHLLLGLAESNAGFVPYDRVGFYGGRIAFALAGSPLLALPVALAFADATTRDGLLAVAAIYLVYHLGRSRSLRKGDRKLNPERSLALEGAISRTLTKAIAGGERNIENQLWRAQGLCLAVGERMELDDETLDALRTAALLHDIGKVGVPEPILEKPGALTPHEMESIRSHPQFGAEMLASISVPESVCSIVQHHHERWDGRGYPESLQGNLIPIGARILAAVDNYIALTSARPFRRAIPWTEAQRHLKTESGKMFDPEVVDALLRILEEEGDSFHLVAPTTGPVEPIEAEEAAPAPELTHGQRQLNTLYELEKIASYPIAINDCFNLATSRIAALVPHRSLVVYLLNEDERRLEAAFTAGQGADALKAVTVTVGERLSGWAVRHRRGTIGRDHSDVLQRDGARSDLEFWLDDPRLAGLNSTLVAPLIVGDRCLGALTLYDGPERQFGGDDRRRLMEAAGYLAQAALRARQLSQTENGGMTDRLTGLPDGRFLLSDAEERLTIAKSATTQLGFLAFQVSRTTEQIAEHGGAELAGRGLCEIARRLAAQCREGETLTRFGPDMFVVVSPLAHADELLERWNDFIHSVESEPLELVSDAPSQPRMVSAHVAYPDDGDELQELLTTLQDRLSLATDRGATIVPFRSAARTAS